MAHQFNSGNVAIIAQIADVPQEILVPDVNAEYTRVEILTSLRYYIEQEYTHHDVDVLVKRVADLAYRHIDNNIDIVIVRSNDPVDEFMRIVTQVHDYYSANRDVLASLDNIYTKSISYYDFIDMYSNTLPSAKEILALSIEYTVKYGNYPNRVVYKTDGITYILTLSDCDEPVHTTVLFDPSLDAAMRS